MTFCFYNEKVVAYYNIIIIKNGKKALGQYSLFQFEGRATYIVIWKKNQSLNFCKNSFYGHVIPVRIHCEFSKIIKESKMNKENRQQLTKLIMDRLTIQLDFEETVLVQYTTKKTGKCRVCNFCFCYTVRSGPEGSQTINCILFHCRLFLHVLKAM